MDKNNFVIHRSHLLESKQDFARRFNIENCDNKFYNRCITTISTIIDNGQGFNILTDEIFLLIGEINIKRFGFADTSNKINDTFNFNFEKTKLYSLLKLLSNDECFLQFIESIECIINFYCKEKDNNMLKSFNNFAVISNKNIRLCYNDKYRFYPSGAELFDKKLVDDILEFLQPYKDAHKELSEALQAFLKNSYRDAVDKTRLALEVFLKELLSNQKPLEKQKECLGKYLGEYMHQNIKSMFLQILDFYAKFNNDKAKHNSGDFEEYEVEFLFYLVGTFIRLFMQVEKDKRDK